MSRACGAAAPGVRAAGLLLRGGPLGGLHGGLHGGGPGARCGVGGVVAAARRAPAASPGPRPLGATDGPSREARGAAVRRDSAVHTAGPSPVVCGSFRFWYGCCHGIGRGGRLYLRGSAAATHEAHAPADRRAVNHALSAREVPTPLYHVPMTVAHRHGAAGSRPQADTE